MERVYLGLGANLNDPIKQLIEARQALLTLEGCQDWQFSALYGSKPMGPQDQPDYVNAVASCLTRLAPEQLLDCTQKIELEQGRVRKENRWGPRTLDIDLLLFGTQCINTERLTVPHYGMTEREFVIYPLFELAPTLMLPHGTTVANLKNTLPSNGLTLLTKTWQ